MPGQRGGSVAQALRDVHPHAAGLIGFGSGGLDLNRYQVGIVAHQFAKFGNNTFIGQRYAVAIVADCASRNFYHGSESIVRIYTGTGLYGI